MSRVSVIVPVYNAERYLGECIESLLSQTVSDIEIILVNDGSRDGSEAICREYAERDTRVKLLSKQNEGAGRARADGVRLASSPFICFIDSDDYVSADYCEALLEAQQRSDADLVECGYYVFEDSVKNEHCMFDSSLSLDGEGFKSEVILNTIIGGTEAVLLWNKLYKRELFYSLVSDYGVNVLEDYMINMQYYSGVSRYEYVARPLVFYRVVAGSLSRRFNPSLFEELKRIVGVKMQYMAGYGLDGEREMRIHSEWYIRYIESYLSRGVGIKDFRPRLIEIISDEGVISAASAVDGKFARLVADKNHKGVISYLKWQNFKSKVKSVLYRLKINIQKITGK